MLTIEVKSSGFSEAQLAESIFKAATEHVRETLRHTTCPEHGTYVHANLIPDPAGMKIEFVEPCCDELVEAANAALSQT
jgi:hypothetical protein